LGLRFVGASQHETAYYRTGHGRARVDRVVYQDGPGEGRELLTVGNRIFNPKQWTIERATTSAVKTGAPQFHQLVLSSRESGSHMQVLYGFRVRSRWESSSLRVKVWQALYGLAAMPASTEIVVIAAPVWDTSGDAVLDELGRAATRFVIQGGGGRE